MVTVTYRMIILIFLVFGLIFGIAGACLTNFNTNNSTMTAINAFIIIGLITVAIALLLEILYQCVDSVRNSSVAHLVELIVLIISAISFIIAAALMTSRVSALIAMVVCACVFTCQGVFLFVIQWKCA